MTDKQQPFKMPEPEKELRAALELATPGPWTASNRGAYSVGGEDEGSVYGHDGDDTGAEFVRPVGDAPTIRGEMWFRDARFIALARNALPALLAELDALRALRSPADQGEKGWISVDERFPEREISVVGFWTPRDGKVHAGCYSTVCLNQYGVWVNPEDDEDEYTQPTHWMPLPKAPAIDSTKGGSSNE